MMWSYYQLALNTISPLTPQVGTVGSILTVARHIGTLMVGPHYLRPGERITQRVSKTAVIASLLTPTGQKIGAKFLILSGNTNLIELKKA